jgi:hypothetical protein
MHMGTNFDRPRRVSYCMAIFHNLPALWDPFKRELMTKGYTFTDTNPQPACYSDHAWRKLREGHRNVVRWMES